MCFLPNLSTGPGWLWAGRSGFGWSGFRWPHITCGVRCPGQIATAARMLCCLLRHSCGTLWCLLPTRLSDHAAFQLAVEHWFSSAAAALTGVNGHSYPRAAIWCLAVSLLWLWSLHLLVNTNFLLLVTGTLSEKWVVNLSKTPAWPPTPGVPFPCSWARAVGDGHSNPNTATQ